MRTVEACRQVGLSPKLVPSICAAIAGLALVVIGAIKDDTEMILLGIGLLVGGGGGAAMGAAARPGKVLVPSTSNGESRKEEVW